MKIQLKNTGLGYSMIVSKQGGVGSLCDILNLC
jgi:hypothetical protein